MIIVKICYLLLLIGLISFYILYIDSLSLLLLLCALLLPIVLKLLLTWMKIQSNASIICDKDTCTVDESIPVTLLIENHSVFFFPKACASIKICHAFSDAPEKIKLHFPVHGQNTTKLVFYLHAECCGVMYISLENVHVLDYFHLFHANLKKKQMSSEMLILPKKIPVMLGETAEAVYSPESNHYANKAGDDPSEIFNIREYHAGDAVSRIHWKLSSKADTLFIKEFGFPIEKQILLLIEYLPNTSVSGIQKMQYAQAFMTLVYSIADTMLYHRNTVCMMAWCSHDRILCRRLGTEHDLQNIFHELYHAMDNMMLDPQLLQNHLFGQQYSSVTLITNDASNKLLPILEKQADANQKNLLVITNQPFFVSSDSVFLYSATPETLAEGVPSIKI